MIEFTVPDMSCNHCVRTITETVRKVDAVATVECDVPSHRVRIASAQPEDAFRAALADEGYAPA